MAQRLGIIKTLLKASFLLVLIFTLLFLLFTAQADSLSSNPTVFKDNPARFVQIIGTNLIALALVLTYALYAAPEVVRELVKANYWKSFALKFIPSAVLTILLTVLLKGLIKGTGGLNPIDLVANVNPAIIILQVFVITQVEEIIFRGILFESIYKKSSLTTSYIISNGAFGVYHYAASGGSFLTMGLLFVLGITWTYIKLNGYPLLNRIVVKGNRPFGASRLTQQANAGSHFGWNLFIIAFIEPFRV